MAILGFLKKKQDIATPKEGVVAARTQASRPMPLLALLPYHTEKATHLQQHNQWCFEASPRATKGMIATLVAQMWHVRVEKVRMIKQRSNAVWFGKTRGATRMRKKFVVTLCKGDTLPKA